MNNKLLLFCSNLDSSTIASELPNFKPASFPPDDNFFVSVRKDGTPLSKFSDNVWDFTTYDAKRFNFKIQQLTDINKNLLKQLLFLYLYHMPIFPGKIVSLHPHFKVLSKLCKVADSHNISIDKLYRFPKLASEVIKVFTTHEQSRLFMILSQIARSEDILGWKIANTTFIEKLAQLSIPHVSIQNAYIPPRIWVSLIQLAENVIDDFEKNQDSFSKTWIQISDAYKKNIKNKLRDISPFTKSTNNSKKSLEQRIYFGNTRTFLESCEIGELLKRWIGEDKLNNITVLTTYINLVRDCALLFILAHSIQRLNEGLSLRFDTFQIDEDPTLGKVAYLIGETTKTDPDSDARWVVPMHIKKAVDILKIIGQLRLNSTLKNLEPSIEENPYLMIGSIEFWGHSRSTRINGWCLDTFIKRNPKAFPRKNFIINEEDYKIAYLLTPQLTKKPWFKVNNRWSFNTHQLRRTLAVNLFASDIPDSVIQWQMKHKTINQSYYYGRNHTRLRVNKDVERKVTIESYRSVIRQLIETTENTLDDNISPTGKNLIEKSTLNLITKHDHKKLEVLVKKGEIAARPTLLGFCMIQSCEYGGIESAVHCAGVDGNGPCKDAIFSKKNNKKLKVLYDSNSENIKDLTENTPKHSKLKNENEAIEVYFHATSQKR